MADFTVYMQIMQILINLNHSCPNNGKTPDHAHLVGPYSIRMQRQTKLYILHYTLL